MNESLHLFEFGSHFHVIPPWIKTFKFTSNYIYISKTLSLYVDKLKSEYKFSANILDNQKKILWNILFSILFKSRKRNFLIISTAREYLLTKIEFINFVILSLAKPNIVCIRNPHAWYINKADIKKIQFKHYVNYLLSVKIRQILVARSTFIVCESPVQIYQLKAKNKRIIDKNFVVFPGRLADVTPNLKSKPKLKYQKKKLVIGVLGSINTIKRDYEPLLKAIERIQIERRPSLYFLGATTLQESESILNNFKKFTRVYFLKNQTISETEFYLKGKNCDVLLAPLRVTYDYGYNYGTGSIADGIFLNKLIIMPKGINFGLTFNKFLIRYENSNDLKNLFLQNPMDFNTYDTFGEWKVSNLRNYFI